MNETLRRSSLAAATEGKTVNLELSLRVPLDAEVEEPGSVVIPARLAQEVVRALRAERVTLSAAGPDGRVLINPTGNAGMASGGTGDVLTGILGALLARGIDAAQAAPAGVYLHGLAGDIAAERVGEEALIAGDIIDALGEAFRRLADGR